MTPTKEAAAPKKTKAKTAKAPKEPKPKKEKAPQQAMVVFAFRLTAAERDAIHQAAGPGKATRLVKSAALAAASGDVKAFETLIARSTPTK